MSEDNQEADKKPLRRSTRATRGSVKPVADLDEKLALSEDEAKIEPSKSKSKSNKKGSAKVVKEEVINISDDGEDDNDDDDDESVKVLDLSDDEKDEDFEVSKPKRASKISKKTPVSKKQSANKESKAGRKSTTTKKSADSDGQTKPNPKTTKGATKGKEKSIKDEPEPEADDMSSFYDLSEKEMKEINNAFDLNCSSDGDELLASDDLKTAIRSLGFEPRADEIQRLLKKYSNKDGKVNRSNFHKIMSFKMGTSLGLKDSTNDEITRVFNLLDLDKTGFISLENLRSIAQDLNEEITDEELHEMITEADMDGDLMINKQEFYHIMKKTSLY